MLTVRMKNMIATCAKVLLFALLAAASSLSLFSCGKGSDVKLDFAPAEYKIELKPESLDEGGVLASLKYPQIEGSGHDEEINLAMRSFAVRQFKRKNLVAHDDKAVYYTVEAAEITLASENLFSGYIAGRISAEGAQHDDFFSYTFNYDLKNGQLLESGELIDNLSKLRKAFVSGKFTEYPKNKELIDDFGYENLFAAFRDDYAIYPDIYFAADGLGLCIETIYIYGGYSRFVAPYSELGDLGIASLDRFGLQLKK